MLGPPSRFGARLQFIEDMLDGRQKGGIREMQNLTLNLMREIPLPTFEHLERGNGSEVQAGPDMSELHNRLSDFSNCVITGDGDQTRDTFERVKAAYLKLCFPPNQ